MGQEVSSTMYSSQCGAPEKQLLELSDDSDFDFMSDGAKSEASTAVPRTPRSSPGGSPGSPGSPGRKEKTIIIFDWDDTLLCSTAINMQQCCPQSLRELEERVESILNTSMGLGETMIITNGNGSWVQDSAKRFLPRLLPTLAKLTVVSARALYESTYPGDPFMWKKAAFKRLLAQERTDLTACGLNLVALGDQHPEIEAAHNVCKIIGGTSVVKTLKFKEGPSIVELRGQLCRAERDLAKLVNEEQSASRGLTRRQLPSHLDHLTSEACGWRCTLKDEQSWSVARSLQLKDFWPLFA